MEGSSGSSSGRVVFVSSMGVISVVVILAGRVVTALREVLGASGMMDVGTRDDVTGIVVTGVVVVRSSFESSPPSWRLVVGVM